MKVNCRLLKSIIAAVVMVFMAGVVVGCAGGAGGKQSKGGMPQRLTIGASEPGSSWYPMAAAMKEVLEKEFPGTKVDIFYGGGDINLKALEEKKIDFGITFGVTAADAKAGKGRFEKPLQNISSAMGLYLAALQMVVRPDSGINSISDLKGKKISTGMPGYATTGIFEQILPLYGLKKEDVKWVSGTASDIAGMFKDRTIDFCAVHSTIRVPFPMIQDIASQTPITLLGIDDQIMEQLREMNPGHQKVVIPANLYRGLSKEVTTEGTVGMLATRADLSEEVVYNVVSALIKNADYLAKAVADLSYISADKSSKGLGISLHPGAEKYYKEKGTL
ncbi:TRAP transporter solute receptor, TAXI family [Moorella glycerini]|uniref:Alkanesulfonate transporter substrate-binding subunit n=1 Tax=Neomoorella stamsii TaxID=1266720 RepID=A0A9X7J2Y0_9FIRM|nr:MULTISPECIES: TAXI family TRAP transporter solute-binding subunit [Moorella]PRR73421.1 alkanesulfonate transporter substrate-binding subunit [Moorella stamsii]CEP69190.1 TRAP transporter solute receptor, TAXI family [Moorella glycerini]